MYSYQQCTWVPISSQPGQPLLLPVLERVAIQVVFVKSIQQSVRAAPVGAEDSSGSVSPGGAMTPSSCVKNYGTGALLPRGGIFRFADKLFNRGVARDNQSNLQLFVVGKRPQASPMAHTEGRSQDRGSGSQRPAPSLRGGEPCLSLPISGLIPFR